MTLTDEMVAGEHRALVASLCGRGISKRICAVVSIDKCGGHRHYFECGLSGHTKLTTESLAAAIRWYNKQGDEA